MKLVLDELWPPEIAIQLRRRGFDVIAATEPDYADRYRHIEDELVFARAQEDGRAVVTDNVDDFEPLRLAYEARSDPHHGVIYALDPPFNRHRSEFVIGPNGARPRAPPHLASSRSRAVQRSVLASPGAEVSAGRCWDHLRHGGRTFGYA